MNYELSDFRVGDRIELHPATDLWLQGARFGTVDRITRKGLIVFVDAINRQAKILPRNICGILSE